MNYHCNNPLRTLARSIYWQTLYARSKEMDIKLFYNDVDHTKIQITFLQYLEVYNSIYTDIAMGEKLITYDKIKDDMLVDAYLVYKRKKKEGKTKLPEMNQKNILGAPSIIFRPKRGDNK